MATTRNHDSSTMSSINRNCLAEECESSGECSNDISFTDDWGESSTYLSPNSYRQMLSLCDIASGMSHHSPLPLRVQMLHIISQYVYDHGMSQEPIDVCEEPGTLICKHLHIPSRLQSEIANHINQTVILYFEKYIEPFIPCISE